MKSKLFVIENACRVSLLILISAFFLSGCKESGEVEKEDPQAIKIYYVNSSETGLAEKTYQLKADVSSTQQVIDEMIKQLAKAPNDVEYEAPLTGRISLNRYELKDGTLTLYFDASYKEVAHVTEILDRAAMVRTFSQAKGVSNVAFVIGDEPLIDNDGDKIGNMKADTFIYNAGNEINTYEKVTLTLYFANANGDHLAKVYRTVVYNSNISMERLAIEQLVAGPNTDKVIATVNPASKINSVTVRDGICYVDFNSDFLTQTNRVTAETAIYSLVNSLTTFADVEKVQISIDGKTNVKFMDTLDLSLPLEENEEIVEE
ncbi:GerMN domain-containing protein [Butyrivibrio sp. NC3005]|uniref:GerMN domain-containing protein n=1 Tax=Butyrivibrio sp. NC3005 TaxID=1280685 RepID=UPI0004027D3E|nr:GerMN domain-containing protein [Butyrivibrio sp. NC3005]